MRIIALLLASLLLATGAVAQTALLDTPRFHLNDDGSLVSLGAFGTGAIPTTGPGTRLMWHPRKSAFRVGTVNGTQWDEANIGIYSVAMGSRTTASGEFATAMGRSTTASGNDATAMGAMTTASGVQSTASGGGATASGNYATASGFQTVAGSIFSVAMGDRTAAYGEASVALGSSTTASGQFSTALGSSTTASGSYATAMGSSTTASGNQSTAMGRQTTANGTRSTAMGQNTTASGPESTAMGHGTTASGADATAMGDHTEASGDDATAMGHGTTASGANATAMGYGTTASGLHATAMGYGTAAQAYASLVLGRYNTIAGEPSTWVATDPVLVVGNGTASNRSNAFTLLKNGNLSIAGSLTQNSDRRLKRDIEPLTDALAGIEQLQAVRFRFRAGMNRPEGTQIGLIAQEVEAVFPELISEGADGYLSVSYTNLVAVLVQALNEQQIEIETLKKQQVNIEALRAEIAALRSAVETRPTAVGAAQ